MAHDKLILLFGARVNNCGWRRAAYPVTIAVRHGCRRGGRENHEQAGSKLEGVLSDDSGAILPFIIVGGEHHMVNWGQALVSG